jgi:hypothetical protein
MRAEKALDQSDRGRAVDIVVAEHGDRFARLDGRCEAIGRFLHVLQARWVWQQRFERWIEEAGDRLRICAARGQDASE